MKKVILEALGMTVKVDDSVHFHDDAYVKSMKRHMREIERKYDVPKRHRYHVTDSCGLCSPQDDEFGNEHYHIFYLMNEDETWNFNVRAHEETHALVNMGFSHLLERKMKREGIDIDFDSISNREVIAELGACHALFKNGLFNHETLRQFRGRKNGRKAWSIYEQSFKR